jgi:hypothetical protein
MASRARLGERAAVGSTTQRRDRSAAPHTRALDALRAHEHWLAAGVFLLVVVVYLWPALVQGRPLLAASALYVRAPWNTVVPPDVMQYYNAVLNAARVRARRAPAARTT